MRYLLDPGGSIGRLRESIQFMNKGGIYIYTHYIHHIHIHIYIYLIDIISWGMPNPWFTVGKIVITVFLTIHDLHLLSLSIFTAFLEDHPFRKWLGSPLFKSHRFRPFGRGPTSPGIVDLRSP